MKPVNKQINEDFVFVRQIRELRLQGNSIFSTHKKQLRKIWNSIIYQSKKVKKILNTVVRITYNRFYDLNGKEYFTNCIWLSMTINDTPIKCGVLIINGSM